MSRCNNVGSYLAVPYIKYRCEDMVHTSVVVRNHCRNVICDCANYLLCAVLRTVVISNKISGRLENVFIMILLIFSRIVVHLFSLHTYFCFLALRRFQKSFDFICSPSLMWFSS